MGLGAEGGTRNDLSGHAGYVVQAGSIADGVHLHTPEADASPPVPRQLPLAASGFVNRVRELKRLDSVAALAASIGAGTRLLAVTGGPGVGKTALVVHWARRQTAGSPTGSCTRISAVTSRRLRAADSRAGRVPAHPERPRPEHPRSQRLGAEELAGTGHPGGAVYRRRPKP